MMYRIVVLGAEAKEVGTLCMGLASKTCATRICMNFGWYVYLAGLYCRLAVREMPDTNYFDAPYIFGHLNEGVKSFAEGLPRDSTLFTRP